MRILSKEESVSNEEVLNVVTNVINKFKSMEESKSERTNDPNMGESSKNEENKPEISENRANKSGSDLNGNKKLSNQELWQLRVNSLNQFSVPTRDSSDHFASHIHFLESVRKYLSS